MFKGRFEFPRPCHSDARTSHWRIPVWSWFWSKENPCAKTGDISSLVLQQIMDLQWLGARSVHLFPECMRKQCFSNLVWGTLAQPYIEECLQWSYEQEISEQIDSSNWPFMTPTESHWKKPVLHMQHHAWSQRGKFWNGESQPCEIVATLPCKEAGLYTINGMVDSCEIIIQAWVNRIENYSSNTKDENSCMQLVMVIHRAQTQHKGPNDKWRNCCIPQSSYRWPSYGF